MDFRKGPEETSIPSIVSGMMTLHDVNKLTECEEKNKLLKSYGLSEFEIKLYNDSNEGTSHLESVHRNIEKSVLYSMLKEVNDKIEHYKSSHSTEQKRSIHPINQLNELKNDLFGHLDVDELPPVNKRRKFIRRMTRKLNKSPLIPEPKKLIVRKPEASIKSAFPDFVKSDNIRRVCESGDRQNNSKWDVKDTDIVQTTGVPMKSTEKRKIGCSSNALYTIKDNKIVRLERKAENLSKYETTEIKLPINKAEEKLLEGKKLDISDIRKMEKIENYSPGSPSKVLFVKNLSSNTNEEILKSLFENYENYTNIRLMTGRMKGQAFITFDDIHSATLALQERNGTIINGKPMIIQYGRKT